MSTLHRIREFALAATLGVGALVGSAALACDEPTGVRASVELFADLGHMTVEAPRDATVLGSVTVTAERLPDIDLDNRFADLGGMTVEASRIDTIRIAARTAK